MQISITSNMDLLTRHLQKLQKQIPFIAAKALSDIAIDVQKATTRQLNKDLDRPTPFTQRAIRYKRATKRSLQSVVYIGDIQAKYLKNQIVGGFKRPNKIAIPVPFQKNLKLNKYGNMTKRKVKILLSKSNTFSGEIKGVAGIYRRGKRKRLAKSIKKNRNKVTYTQKVTLLVAYEPLVKYKENFYYYERARSTANKVINIRINKAIKFALLTAK